jgi:hypothetical protein
VRGGFRGGGQGGGSWGGGWRLCVWWWGVGGQGTGRVRFGFGCWVGVVRGGRCFVGFSLGVVGSIGFGYPYGFRSLLVSLEVSVLLFLLGVAGLVW